MAEALAPELVLLEGSGAAVPPVAADRTVLVTSAHPPSRGADVGLRPGAGASQPSWS